MSAALEGRRLLLRPLSRADASALFAAVEASREVLTRRMGWPEAVRGVEDEEKFIAGADGESGRHVFGVFGRQEEGLVGVAALLDLQAASRKARIALWIRADAQDRGFGSEALKALTEYGFTALDLHRLYGRIDPANRPARKIFKKLKYRYEGTLREDARLNGRWVHQECWGLLKTEWQRTRK